MQDQVQESDLSNSSIGENSQQSIKSRLKSIGEKNQLAKVESDVEYYKRLASQYGARAAETVFGLPGNMKRAYLQVVDYLKNSSIGKKLPFKDTSELEEKSFGKPEVGSISYELQNPMTSQEIRGLITPEVAEQFGENKEYLEPKNKIEEAGGELVEDLTSMFLPGTKGMKFLSRIGAPILGNLSKEGLKFLGVSDETAQNAKLGTMLVTSIAGQANASKFAGSRIEEAKNMIPDHLMADVSKIDSKLAPLNTRMNRGFKTSSKSKVKQGIDELNEQIQDGKMNLKSLMDMRDNINEWIGEAGGWDVTPIVRKATVKNLNELKSSVIKTIDENLARINPQALNLYQTGYEAAAVAKQSQMISNFIEDNFGKKVSSVGAKVLFPGLAGGAAVLPKTAAAATALLPVYKTGQVIHRVANSPTLAKYYSEVLRSSAQQNIPAMIANMQKLDKELLKEETKDQKNRKTSLEEFKIKFKNKS